MSTESQSNEHRRLRRKKGKRGTSFSCRLGKLGLGKDQGVAVQDLSEEGARLLVKEEIAVGAEVEITLSGIGSTRRVVAIADVLWCKTEAPHFSIGVRFRERLPYVDYFNLT